MEKQDILFSIFEEDTGIKRKDMKEIMINNLQFFQKTKTREDLGVKTVEKISESDAIRSLKDILENYYNKDSLNLLFGKILSSSWSLPYMKEHIEKLKTIGSHGKDYYQLFRIFYLDDDRPDINTIAATTKLSRGTVYKYRDEGIILLGYLLINQIVKQD